MTHSIDSVEDISTGSDSDYSRYGISFCCQLLHSLISNNSLRSIEQLGNAGNKAVYNIAKWLFQWISWFLSSKGNEYFCEVDEDFILDRFNLTGLNNEVANYSQALDLITDNLGMLLSCQLPGNWVDFYVPFFWAQMMTFRIVYEDHWTSKQGYYMVSFMRGGLSRHEVWPRWCVQFSEFSASILKLALDREVQASRLWTMSTCAMQLTGPFTRRAHWYPLWEICQALLWSLRRSILTKILSTRKHRWSIFRHNFSSPPLPRLPQPHPPEKWASRFWWSTQFPRRSKCCRSRYCWNRCCKWCRTPSKKPH